RADLEGTSFAAAVDALLVRSADGWSALLPLAALGSGDLKPGAVAQVRAALAGEPRVHTVLLDLKAEADRLYSSYLTEAARLALAGLGARRARLHRRPRHRPRARRFRAAQPAAEAGGRGAGERAMIRSIVDAAHSGRSAPTLIVMLPPAYSGPEDFVRAGFVAAA